MVKLWIRCEIFEFGLVPFPPTSRVDASSLFGLAATLRQTESARAGRLKYADWVTAAKSCLNLAESQACVYFDLFDVLQQTNAAAAVQRTREDLAAGSTIAARPRADATVALYEFLLFLFVQLYNKGSPRLRKMEDVWPEARSSPRSPSAPGGSRGDEALYLSYVKRHIVEMLHLLLADGTASAVLSKLQLDRLGFLIAGGPSFRSESAYLSSLTSFWDTGARMVQIEEIADWLNANLAVNTFLYPSATPVSPAAVPRAVMSDEVDAEPSIPRPTVLANLHKRTIVKSDSEVHGGVVRISNCNNCVIYIVASCRYALLSNCVNCIVLVGAVQHVLLMDRCERTKLVAVARAVRVVSCKESMLNICCSSPTLVTGTNHELVLGPYNTHYPKLETHLVQAGVNPLINRWDQFVVAWPPPLTHPAGPVDEGFGRSVKLLSPEQFVPFVVPFSMRGSTVCNPCKMPPAFMEALKKKQRAILELREQLLRVRTDDATQRELQTVVEGQFKEWLATSGNMRQIYDLLRAPSEL